MVYQVGYALWSKVLILFGPIWTHRRLYRSFEVQILPDWSYRFEIEDSENKERNEFQANNKIHHMNCRRNGDLVIFSVERMILTEMIHERTWTKIRSKKAQPLKVTRKAHIIARHSKVVAYAFQDCLRINWVNTIGMRLIPLSNHPFSSNFTCLMNIWSFSIICSSRGHRFHVPTELWRHNHIT